MFEKERYVFIFGSGFSGSSIVSDWLSNYNEFSLPKGEELKFIQHGVAGIYFSKKNKIYNNFYGSLYSMVPSHSKCNLLIKNLNDISTHHRIQIQISIIRFFSKTLIKKLLKPRLASYKDKLEEHFGCKDIIENKHYMNHVEDILYADNQKKCVKAASNFLHFLSNSLDRKILILDNSFTGEGLELYFDIISERKDIYTFGFFISRNLRSQYIDIIWSQAYHLFWPKLFFNRRNIYSKFEAYANDFHADSHACLSFEDFIVHQEKRNSLLIKMENALNISITKKKNESFNINTSRKNIDLENTRLKRVIANVISKLS